MQKQKTLTLSALFFSLHFFIAIQAMGPATDLQEIRSANLKTIEETLNIMIDSIDPNNIPKHLENIYYLNGILVQLEEIHSHGDADKQEIKRLKKKTNGQIRHLERLIED